MESNEPPKNTLYIIFKRVYLKNELGDSHFLLLEINWHPKTKLIAKFKKIGHFRNHACLLFKPDLSAKISIHSYVK